MNRGEEDYIKAIYELEIEQNNPLISNQQLVEFFSHSAQTVSEMIKRLDKHHLIKYTPYKGSVLTEKGKKAAIRLVRVHRIWEKFLVDHLRYRWDEVHEEAERLEHVTSERLEKEMFEFLESPKFDPIGNPIPDMEGKINRRDSVKLWSISKKGRYEIIRVSDDVGLLKYLDRFNIRIGDSLTVEVKDSFSEVIEAMINGKRLVLSKKVASMIYVN